MSREHVARLLEFVEEAVCTGGMALGVPRGNLDQIAFRRRCLADTVTFECQG